jgi:fatty acid desaturase
MTERIDMKSMKAILIEWAFLILALFGAYQTPSIWLKIILFVFISIRQHALWMLFHDAVHFNLSPSKRLNDLIANVFLSVPLLLPLHTFRAIHFAHHKNLGTEDDPEKVINFYSQPWNFKGLKLAPFVFQCLGDIFVVNNFLSLFASARYFGKKNSSARNYLSAPRVEYIGLNILLISGLVILFFKWKALFSTLMIFWFLPIFTLSFFIHKIRSLAEHGENGENLTLSWEPGLVGQFIIWPYNINYHREHHTYPALPWHALGTLKSGTHREGKSILKWFIPSL